MEKEPPGKGIRDEYQRLSKLSEEITAEIKSTQEALDKTCRSRYQGGKSYPSEIIEKYNPEYKPGNDSEKKVTEEGLIESKFSLATLRALLTEIANNLRFWY